MSSKSEIKKPRLNETRLNKCNIYFFAKIHVNEDLPDILKTTQHVLQFQGSISWKRKYLMERELEVFREPRQNSKNAPTTSWNLRPPRLRTDPVYIQRKSFYKVEETAEMKATLEESEKIRDEAIALRESNEAETEWMTLLRRGVFASFTKTYPDAKTYQSVPSLSTRDYRR